MSDFSKYLKPYGVGTLVKRGSVFILTTGEYSDYSVVAILKAKRAIDLHKEVAGCLAARVDRLKSKFSDRVYETEFLNWLVNISGAAEELPHTELQFGSDQGWALIPGIGDDATVGVCVDWATRRADMAIENAKSADQREAERKEKLWGWTTAAEAWVDSEPPVDIFVGQIAGDPEWLRVVDATHWPVGEDGDLTISVRTRNGTITRLSFQGAGADRFTLPEGFIVRAATEDDRPD